MTRCGQGHERFLEKTQQVLGAELYLVALEMAQLQETLGGAFLNGYECRPPPQLGPEDMPGMQGMQMPGMDMGGNPLITMHPETFLQEVVGHDTSGTSAEPDSSCRLGPIQAVRLGRFPQAVRKIPPARGIGRTSACA